MRTLRSFVNRWKRLRNRALDDRELTAELQSHLDLHVDDSIRAGMTPEEARRCAVIALGGVAQAREQHRDARGAGDRHPHGTWRTVSQDLSPFSSVRRVQHYTRMDDRGARRHLLSEWLMEFSVLWAVFPLLDRFVEGRPFDLELVTWSIGISLTTLLASFIPRIGDR